MLVQKQGSAELQASVDQRDVAAPGNLAVLQVRGDQEVRRQAEQVGLHWACLRKVGRNNRAMFCDLGCSLGRPGIGWVDAEASSSSAASWTAKLIGPRLPWATELLTSILQLIYVFLVQQTLFQPVLERALEHLITHFRPEFVPAVVLHEDTPELVRLLLSRPIIVGTQLWQRVVVVRVHVEHVRRIDESIRSR